MSDPSAAAESSGPSVHVPVLLRETLQYLDLHPGLVVVDGTVGAGGHSREILKQIGPGGTLIGLDRDPMMLAHARRQLTAPNCRLIHASYAQLAEILPQTGFAAVDRILLDLGLSSDQLADAGRGFSFRSEGPLDLRFDTSQGEPAWALLERIDEAALAQIIADFGEEPHSRKLARKLVEWRARRPLRTARDLAEAVAASGSARASRDAARHPATRVFQALRIAVNHELEQLQHALAGTLHACLRPAGILVVITFQSLEDRLVKQTFRESNLWQPLNPKPVTASPAEQRINPRSRTARLRGARRI
jgi:16S rRNA (cytosine1402-N4)-methyltransferase